MLRLLEYPKGNNEKNSLYHRDELANRPRVSLRTLRSKSYPSLIEEMSYIPFA